MEKITRIEKAQQIKDIIEPIPAEDFTIGRFEDEDTGKCCVLGHIHKHISGNSWGDSDGFGARYLSERFTKAKYPDITEDYGEDISIAHINNAARFNGYTEPVIKDRVMHFVNDMIAAGY